MYTVHRRSFTMLGLVALVSVLALAMFGATNAEITRRNAAADPSQTVLTVDDGQVVVIDAATGKVLHRPDVRSGSQSYFLEAHLGTQRFFFATWVYEQGRAVEYVLVYRMTDWQLEQRVPVPDIIRYLGDQTGIAVSPNGRLLYVYNYNDRTRGSAPVRYWLSVYDIHSGRWTEQTFELPNCGASQLHPVDATRAYVFCYDSDAVWEVDTAENVARSVSVEPANDEIIAGRDSKMASMVISQENIYMVSENREVHVLDAMTLEREMVLGDHAVDERIVPFEPVAISADRTKLVVATGDSHERSEGLASQLSLIDIETGATLRTIRTSAPFRGLAFSSDGSTVFLVLVDESLIFGEKLVRVDLQSGSEVELFTGELSSRLLVPGP